MKPGCYDAGSVNIFPYSNPSAIPNPNHIKCLFVYKVANLEKRVFIRPSEMPHPLYQCAGETSFVATAPLLRSNKIAQQQTELTAPARFVDCDRCANVSNAPQDHTDKLGLVSCKLSRRRRYDPSTRVHHIVEKY